MASSRYSPISVTIPAASDTSSAVDATAFVFCGIVLPATFTGTAITFEVSADGVNFAPLYDSSNAEVSLTVTQGRAYVIPSEVFDWLHWRIVSGATESAERVIRLSLKG